MLRILSRYRVRVVAPPMIPTHPVLFGLAAIALLAGTTVGVGELGGDFPIQRAKVEARGEIKPRTIHLAHLCVTSGGFCTIRPTQANNPCSCSHPLRGLTFGHAYSEAELVTQPELMP